MTKSRRHALLFSLLAGLFLWVQSTAVVHAASYSDGPHEHHGVPCEMYRLSGTEDIILPAPVAELPSPLITDHTTYELVFSDGISFWPPERAPPPRGPPLITQ